MSNSVSHERLSPTPATSATGSLGHGRERPQGFAELPVDLLGLERLMKGNRRNGREEATLFPLLHERLIADGEHSKGEVPTTATDLMEDERAKATQLAAVVVNVLGLAFRLPDERSRLIVLDAALEQGKNLVELLRLHVFREDNVVFSLAHRLISRAEFDEMQSRAAVARKSS